MAEYIEREARYIDIKKVTIPRGFFNQDLNVPKLFDWLESQPAADVVEVVRCKECVFSRKLDKHEKKLYLENCVGCTKHSSSYYSFIMQDNDFCSFGERKEGEGE